MNEREKHIENLQKFLEGLAKGAPLLLYCNGATVSIPAEASYRDLLKQDIETTLKEIGV